MIQEREVEADQGEGETQAEVQDDAAEFSGAWDELEAEGSGQPSEADGRRDNEAEEESEEGDEAGQGVADEASAPPSADATASRDDETPDDIWANADPRQLAELDAERQGRIKAEKLVRSNGARAARALNDLHTLQASLNAKRDEAGATEKGAEATDRTARLEQLREEYPEVAAPILDKMADLERTVEKLTVGEEAKRVDDHTSYLIEQEDELRGAHGDFDQIISSTDYRDWLAEQSAMIRGTIEANTQGIVDAASCSDILSKFKADSGWGQTSEAVEETASRRREQLDAGSAVTGRGAPAVSRDTSDSFEDEWDRLDRKESQKVTARR